MDEKLRNLTSIYITKGDKMLLLFRQGGRVVSDTWVGSAGGHFEEYELNDPKACVLRELKEELQISEKDIRNLAMRYITLRWIKGGWFTLSELPALEMPFTAKFVVEHYLKTGRNTKDLYVGVADEKGVNFTKLPEYESSEH